MKKWVISHLFKKTIIYGAILGLFLAFLVAIPTAKAITPFENDYVKFVKFSYNSIDDLYVDMYVKTSFQAQSSHDYIFEIGDIRIKWYTYPTYQLPEGSISPFPENHNFLAGYTYRFYLSKLGGVSKEGVENALGRPLNKNDILESSYYYLVPAGISPETQLINFSESPILEIDYPQDNAEIAGAFNLQGSYYAPEGYTNLDVFVFRTYEDASSTYSFLYTQYYLDITEGEHNFSKLISDLPKGDYYFQFKFYKFSTREDFWIDTTINFSVLEDIPPVLGETSPQPIPPSYIQVNPDVWYSQNSSYATPTALFTSFSKSIAPVFSSIGNYLYNFNSRFTASNAQETGEKLGNSIVLARSYLTNFNQFFNDLPVGQFLMFYIIALVLIIVFRVIKTLIILIKP